MSTTSRRAQSNAPYGLTVRVDLLDVGPPVWRRLVLPSTLRLDELHDVLQAVFVWEDCHLHCFTLGETPWDEDGEHFLCPFDVADGERDGVPASTVRLDEVLAAPGDRLLYAYDHGDDWQIRLVAEAVGEPVEQVRLIDGVGAAPPEDCGRVWDEGPFDADQAQRALAQLRRFVPPEVAQVLLAVGRSHPAATVVHDLLDEAALSEPVLVDETMARDTLRRYLWLLHRVGDGIALTGAGWLPPTVVTQAMDEAFPGDGWIGKHNREDMTEPVRRLRMSAQKLGLLRVTRGRLAVTKAGAAVREDPVGLWRHVSERLAVPPKDAFERQACALLLLSVAAGRVDVEALAEVLGAAGWTTGDGGRVPTYALVHHQLDDVLRATDAYDRSVVTEGGRALAQAASTALTSTSSR